MLAHAMSESPGSRAFQHGIAASATVLPAATHHIEHIDADPMDVTPQAHGSMGPPMHSSPETDPHGHHLSNGVISDSSPGQSVGMGSGLSAAAATSSQQPKVVQTAFIHKLYRYEVCRVSWKSTLIR